MDHVRPEVRSKIMAAVRSRDNASTEAVVGKWLWAAGLRGYRKHWNIDGRPDFAWPGLKIAVFVDGCFWHGCRCKRLPKSNVDFWRSKIDANRRRDRRVSRRLRRLGWAVVRVKECQIRRGSGLEVICRIVNARRPANSATVPLRTYSAAA